MRFHSRTPYLFPLLMVVAAGCAEQADSAGPQAPLSRGLVAVQQEALTIRQFDWKVLGFSFNLSGRDLNGTGLNGEKLDGRQVVGVSLEGATLAGEPLDELRVAETRFFASADRGRRMNRREMVGLQLQALLDDDTLLPLRIDAAERHPERSMRDVWLYSVSYATAEGWLPLCGLDEAGEPVRATALQGRWDFGQGVPGGGDHIEDPTMFTFACRGFVLAKCVEAGYKPWQRALVCSERQRPRCQRTTLRSHHQACTRMLRADYCGDGLPRTNDGLWVNAFDGIGIRYDAEQWAPEAEWDAGGARCVARTRLPDQPSACVAGLLTSECGDPANFAVGALLISEVATEQ